MCRPREVLVCREGNKSEPLIRDTTVITALFADPRHSFSGRVVLAFDLPTTVGRGIAFVE
jgi:hypothetical protein